LTQLNGLDFHVEIDGTGPPLLLLHGFTGSVRAWDGLRPALRQRATLIALDLIGHGHTSSPGDAARYTLDWCARDLGALLDELRLDSVNLLGYSMGGRVALHFAVHRPERVRTLILESASPGIEDNAERLQRVKSDVELAERIERDGIPAFVDEWERLQILALRPHVPAGVRANQHAQRLLNNPLGLANSLRGMGAGQQHPLWAQLSGLQMPVQLIVGKRDSHYRAIAERMRALLPNADLAVVPDAGHTVHLDQPGRFASLVLDRD
jgi:2-succinyl-6-hydroxy-2,4-cyclohexadiene-1-carboxylate synthase